MLPNELDLQNLNLFEYFHCVLQAVEINFLNVHLLQDTARSAREEGKLLTSGFQKVKDTLLWTVWLIPIPLMSLTFLNGYESASRKCDFLLIYVYSTKG